jgi:hypothetical protein
MKYKRSIFFSFSLFKTFNLFSSLIILWNNLFIEWCGFRLLFKLIGIFHDLWWVDWIVSLSLVLMTVSNINACPSSLIVESIGTWPL